jgi:hypothetical protein
MIKLLNQSDWINVKVLLIDNGDIFITKNNTRIYLSQDANALKYLLKTQTVFGLYEEGLQGIMVILKEKNYRTFLKVCANNRKTLNALLKYFLWNHCSTEIYVKVHKNSQFNSIISQSIKGEKSFFGFKFLGYREKPYQEVLWHRPKTEKPEVRIKEEDLILELKEQRKRIKKERLYENSPR